MIYRLKIQVKEGNNLPEYPVSRVIELSDKQTLDDLCRFLMLSLNFRRDDVYRFTIKGNVYESSFNPLDDMEPIGRRISSFRMRKGWVFTLDYGWEDPWRFEISVEFTCNGSLMVPHLLGVTGQLYPYANEKKDTIWDKEASFDLTNGEDVMGDLPDWTFHASDELYKAAFEFRESNAWEEIRASYVYGIRLEGNRPAFISVMGAARKTYGVAVFIGDDALRRALELLKTDENVTTTMQNRLISINSLQMMLDTKEDLQTEEIEDALAYAQAHGYTMKRRHAWPHFVKYEEGYKPWHPDNIFEDQILTKAIRSAIWIEKEERRVNAKSLLGILSLGIVGGTAIRIIADGTDEEQAVAALVELVDSGFSDESR